MNVTVNYNLLSCARIANSAKGVTLTASLTPVAEGGSYRREIRLERSAYAAKATFSVEPGAYFIWGDIDYGDRHFCSAPMGDVIVALRGHPQTVQSDMQDDIIADDVTHAYVAGLVDPDMHVALYTSPAPISCGSTIDFGKLWSAEPQIAGNAYYAVLPGEPSPPDEGKAAAIMRLSQGSREAFIVLPVKFPSDIGANSTFLRFDATRDILDKYATAGNTVACINPSEH